MTTLIRFFQKIGIKSSKYSLVWSYIFSRIDLENEIEFSIFDIISKLKINQKTLYPILNFGFDFFNQSDFEYCFDLKKHTIFIVKRENFQQKQKKQRTYIKKSTSSTTKAKISNPKEYNNNQELVNKIIKYLNTSTKKDFSPNNIKTIEIINSRLSEGFDEKDFYFIIDLKCKQWLNSFNDQFLRPITLFGNKMESYINEKEINSKTQSTNNQTQISYENVTKARSILEDRRNKNNSKES